MDHKVKDIEASKDGQLLRISAHPQHDFFSQHLLRGNAMDSDVPDALTGWDAQLATRESIGLVCNGFKWQAKNAVSGESQDMCHHVLGVLLDLILAIYNQREQDSLLRVTDGPDFQWVCLCAQRQPHHPFAKPSSQRPQPVQQPTHLHHYKPASRLL